MENKFYEQLGKMYWEIAMGELKFNTTPREKQKGIRHSIKMIDKKYKIDKLTQNKMGYTISNIHNPRLTKID